MGYQNVEYTVVEGRMPVITKKKEELHNEICNQNSNI